MIKTEGSILINRAIDEVFQYTNDNVVEWSLTVVEDRVINQTPDGVGTTFLCVTADRGTKMEFQGVITRYEPPVVCTMELTGEQFDITVAYKFEDVSGQTRVTQMSLVHPKGFFVKAIFSWFGWMISRSGCNAVNRELTSLKQHLERPAGQNQQQPDADS